MLTSGSAMMSCYGLPIYILKLADGHIAAKSFL